MLFGKKYKKIVIVEGMHCSHCAKKVEEALKKIDGVNSVKIDLDNKKVLITSKKELENEFVKKAISALDYEVIGIN